MEIEKEFHFDRNERLNIKLKIKYRVKKDEKTTKNGGQK